MTNFKIKLLLITASVLAVAACSQESQDHQEERGDTVAQAHSASASDGHDDDHGDDDHADGDGHDEDEHDDDEHGDEQGRLAEV